MPVTGRMRIRNWSRSPSEIGKAERLRHNESLMCDFCRAEKRHGYSKHGLNCKRKLRRNGHPGARAIQKGACWMELEEVDVLFDRCKGAVALEAAIGWCDQLLRDAQIGRKVPAKRELRHLADSGCTGKEMLRLILALFYYSYRHPAALPSDSRLTYAISNHLLSLRPREKRALISRTTGKPYEYIRTFGATVRKELGEQIRRDLGAFIANALEWLLKMEDKVNQRLIDLKKELPENAKPVAGGTDERPSE